MGFSARPASTGAGVLFCSEYSMRHTKELAANGMVSWQVTGVIVAIVCTIVEEIPKCCPGERELDNFYGKSIIHPPDDSKF